MNNIQIAQLAWAAKKNKDNLDISMHEMGKTLENIITAMANVDAKITLDMLNDLAKQVELQNKDALMKLMAEKGEFIDTFLKENSEEELEEVDDEELESQAALGSIIPEKKTNH